MSQRTPTEMGIETLRQQWQAHREALEAILEMALGNLSSVDEAELADLLRFMQGQVQYASLAYFSACDPANPRMLDPQYLPWNWGHSNPDTLYASAIVSDRYDYRVFGRLGTAAQNTFGVYAGIAVGSKSVKLNAEDVQLEPDGSFEIFISRKRRGRNWVETLPGMESFASYQVFSDWDTQAKGTVFIECLDEVDPPDVVGLAATLERYANYLERLRENFRLWVLEIPRMMFGPIPDNGILGPFLPPSAQAGAYFTAIKWRLMPGQALMIDLQIPENSPYSSICLTNRWSQMLDIDCRQTSLNEAQSSVEGGRRVRVSLANHDLGVHNWLDARGYTSGIATWRTTHVASPQSPVVTVIQESEVWEHFPASQRVTPRQRAEAIRKRQRHFRYVWAV
jgi:hypothetical protein